MSAEEITIVEKHPRLIRWTHWINFPVLILMIWSGILIYWANRAYIPIPDFLARALRINNRLAEGLAWHFNLMWIFAANGLIYFFYLLLSGKWRQFLPESRTFNGLQKIAYVSIIFCGLGAIVTGIAIYKPVQVGWLTNGLGGYEAARFEHFAFMVIFVLFFIVHVVQVIRAGWNNLRAMVAGYEVERK